jgi:hypothetical protein
MSVGFLGGCDACAKNFGCYEEKMPVRDVISARAGGGGRLV